MSGDKEMLYLAAKAAGYIVAEYTEDGAWVYVDGSLPNDDGEYPIFLWRPRGDDGDALELAVKLRFSIHFEFQGAQECVEVQHSRDDDVGRCQCVLLGLGSDPCAATRRAIVLAAAEIGGKTP